MKGYDWHNCKIAMRIHFSNEDRTMIWNHSVSQFPQYIGELAEDYSESFQVKIIERCCWDITDCQKIDIYSQLILPCHLLWLRRQRFHNFYEMRETCESLDIFCHPIVVLAQAWEATPHPQAHANLEENLDDDLDEDSSEGLEKDPHSVRPFQCQRFLFLFFIDSIDCVVIYVLVVYICCIQC